MTLTQAEQSLVGASSTFKHDAAGPLFRVRQRLAEGRTFNQATAMTQAEPGTPDILWRCAALGSTIPTDLTQLTGP